MALATVRNSYLKLNTSHVLMADWREIAEKLRYTQARGKIASMGKAICKQLKIFTEQAKIVPNNIHIVAHSLGAHIATHVGRCFEGKIARYTKLLPNLNSIVFKYFKLLSFLLSVPLALITSLQTDSFRSRRPTFHSILHRCSEQKRLSIC